MSIASLLSSLRNCLRAARAPFKGVVLSPGIEQFAPSCWATGQCFPEEIRLQLETCIRSTDIGFWGVNIPPSRTLSADCTLCLSPVSLELMDYSQDSTASMPIREWFERVHPEDVDKIRRELNTYLHTEQQPQHELVLRFRLNSEKICWLRLSLRLIAKHSTEGFYLGGILREVTETRLLYKELENQLAFQRELLEILPHPIFIKDKDAHFVAFNRAYEEAFGMSREEFIGKSVMDLEYLPLEARIKYQKEDLHLIKTGTTLFREVDFLLSDGKNHHCLYWSNGLQNPEAEISGIIGLIVDITDRQEMEQNLSKQIEALNAANAEIEKISRTDSLTGMANRREVMEQLERIIAQALRHCSLFCLIMIDIDDFKKINDTYGHAIGDEVLQRFAENASLISRKEDITARLGGEEFLLVLPATSAGGAISTAERICETIRNIEKEPRFTVSVGVVEYDREDNISTLLKRADKAMYNAKHSGKNCVRFLSATAIQKEN